MKQKLLTLLLLIPTLVWADPSYSSALTVTLAAYNNTRADADFWTTFSNSEVTFFPQNTNVRVYRAASTAASLITFTPLPLESGNNGNGYFVPAGTGVLIRLIHPTPDAETHSVTYYTVTGKDVSEIGTNLLHAGTGSMITETQEEKDNYYYYKLTYQPKVEEVTDHTTLGFYYGDNASGGPYAAALNKAYLKVAKSALSAPQHLGISFEEDNATNLSAIERDKTTSVKFFENGQMYILRDGSVYDVVGRIIRK